MKSQSNKQHGFTLIELLVVISIIGVLSTVVLAAVNSARGKGAVAAGQNFDGHTYAAFFDDMSAAWDFDRDTASVTAQDQSGSGNSLSLTVGSQITNTQNPFKAGNALLIDPTLGTPQVAQTTSALNNPPISDFSVSFWVQITGIGGYDFISNNRSVTQGSWDVTMKDSQTGIVYFDYRGSSSLSIVTGPSLSINQWYQIVAVCSANSGSPKVGLYVNGVLVGSAPISGGCTFANGAGNLIYMKGLLQGIGAGIGSQFKYYMDNVRIYKKALPAAYIQEKYFADSKKYQSLALKANHD